LTTALNPHPSTFLATSRCKVLRVSWNVTGTTLATSGDDNTVMLWMKRDKGQWECIGSAFSEDGPW